MKNGRKQQMRRKQKARGHFFTNTTRTVLNTASVGGETKFTIQDMIGGGLDTRFGKLVSIGVQIIPYMEIGGPTAVSKPPVFAQLRLGQPFVDERDEDCPQKPPRLISWVTPTFLKVTPINAFQRMPVSLGSTKDSLNILLTSVAGTGLAPEKFGAVITCKFDLLPQGAINTI